MAAHRGHQDLLPRLAVLAEHFEQLGLGVDAKFPKNGCQVVAHRALAQKELAGNGGHPLPTEQPAEDLPLARRKLLELGVVARCREPSNAVKKPGGAHFGGDPAKVQLELLSPVQQRGRPRVWCPNQGENDISGTTGTETGRQHARFNPAAVAMGKADAAA
jgi:hypothetical protein